MRSLILKIFLCYWIAASLIIVVVDLGPHEQMRRGEATSALASTLRIHGRFVAQAYEAGGCAAAVPLLSDSTNTMILATDAGTMVCPVEPGDNLHFLMKRAASSDVPIAINFHRFQVVALKVSSPSGKPYLLLLKSKYSFPLLSGLVPGGTTVVISAIVTLLLGILVAMPIRRLRRAARDIANGHLEARVQWSSLPRALTRHLPTDVLDALIVDFNHMAERLQTLVGAQRLFFRDVSHELRSPLARLAVALELARLAGTESMSAPLDRIDEEAARINDLVSQLLSLSYVETLHDLSQSTILSLRDLVDTILPDFQYEASSSQCRVIAVALDECTVQGDPVMLHRALENVVRNAIRYTPEDGVVEILVERIERNGSPWAVLRVRDNGPGVPPDELNSILLPFYRVDKSRQRSTGGFGVGLAIADRAVKLHAGEITASNRAEGGLMVEMIFPCAEPAPRLPHFPVHRRGPPSVADAK